MNFIFTNIDCFKFVIKKKIEKNRIIIYLKIEINIHLLLSRLLGCNLCEFPNGEIKASHIDLHLQFDLIIKVKKTVIK